jgi:hypothetical protein
MKRSNAPPGSTLPLNNEINHNDADAAACALLTGRRSDRSRPESAMALSVLCSASMVAGGVAA